MARRTTEVKPPFIKGMTEEEAITFIGQRIAQHQAQHRQTGWTNEELLIRHQLILKWIGEGTPRMDVARRLTNIWNVSDSSAHLYVQQALKYLSESTDEYRDYVRDTQVSKIEKFIEDCKSAGKMKEAAMFQEQLNKIFGIYNESKELKIKTEEPIKFEFGK